MIRGLFLAVVGMIAIDMVAGGVYRVGVAIKVANAK